MEINLQKVRKLKELEQTLSDLLVKIDNEIIQTDVEWLNLKSISEAMNVEDYKTDLASTSQQSTFNIKPTPEDLQNSKPNNNSLNITKFKEEYVNTIQLDLKPHNPLIVYNNEDDEEFDSD